MASPISDHKLKGDFPEVIEEYLEHGVMKCIAFNRRGTLLAAGCADGSCVVWDFETRMIAKELKHEDCTAAVTSVCWSKYGHCILVSAADKTLILWDVATGEKIAKTTLEKPSLHVHLHPGSTTPSLCLASPIYSAPWIVDLHTGKSTVLPVSLSEFGGIAAPQRPKVSDDSTYVPACFNNHGDLVYLGNSMGEILIIDHQSIQVNAVFYVAGGAGIMNVVFSTNGMYLLTNSRDGTIRVYKNMLPSKGGLKALNKMAETLNHLRVIEKLKVIGTKSLVLSRELQDSIARNHLKAPCFNRNGEWTIGGSASKEEHKIYIWDSTGHLVKVLKGPKEALVGLAWHPAHPIIVSLSRIGLVYIWAKDHTENWSAFYPGFKELEQMEEYVEREDEFDIVPEIVPEARKVKEADSELDEDADIVTVESDSEMSEEELCFLPSVPCPDTPEQQEKYAGESQKLADSNGFESCASAQARKDWEAINHEPDLTKGIARSATKAVCETRPKRQRKITEKLLETLVEAVAKKPVRR